MQNYTPLRIHSHYSTSIGLSKPSHLLNKIIKEGFESACITDYNSISGTIDYMETLLKSGKSKPILGTEITVVNQYDRSDKFDYKILLIAKNINGWKSLIKNITNSNINYWNESPHISLKDIQADGLVCITGWLGSSLSKCILGDNIYESWLSTSYENSKKLVNKDWIKDSESHIAELKEKFGQENTYLGVQLIDYCCVPSSRLISEGVRYLARKTATKSVAIPDSYYCEQEDSVDQKVLIVNRLKTDFKNIYKKPVRGAESQFGRFFSNNNYHLPSYNEMINFGHSIEELENSNEIASKCEQIKLDTSLKLPKFKCPDGLDAKSYMEKLCMIGWDRLNLPKNNIYSNRYEVESKVLNDASLADYFLIVEDIIKYAINDGQLVGAGRGSADGSLVLYLLGVTQCDPIKYDLLFERFYNAGRNTPGNIEMPDVDMDFERMGRNRILKYAQEKYGHNKVSQMVTFQRMQGRGALKDVSRAHAALDNITINKITKLIPQEHEIADQLQALKDAGEETGILEWALDNHPKDFQEWAFYDDNGKIQGPLSKIFEQAIRMEGTKRGKSKHASGVIISEEVIGDFCPMTYDSESKELIADLEMNTLGKLGFVKFDFLGLSLLDKIKSAVNYISSGVL